MYLFLNLRNVQWSYSSHPPLIPPVSSRNFWNISHLNQLLQIIKTLAVMSNFWWNVLFSLVLFISIIGAKNVNIWLIMPLLYNCCKKKYIFTRWNLIHVFKILSIHNCYDVWKNDHNKNPYTKCIKYWLNGKIFRAQKKTFFKI